MDQEDNEQKLARAIRLHNEGQLDAAEALYRELLQAVPGHQVALHLAGLVAHQRGRHREAVNLIEMALAGGAATAPIHSNCGVAYRALGEFDRAAQHFARAIELDADFAEAHINYALMLLDQALPQQAAVHLENLLALRPDWPDANFYLGRIRLDEDQPALAAERLRAELALRPDRVEAHYLLALALLDQGDTVAALQSALAALALQPEHVAAARLAAKLSFELCHEGAALAHLDQALRNAPKPELRQGTRAARARLGRIDQWCAAGGGHYTRMARPQWLRLPQPKALPEQESQYFAQPKPFALEIFLARIARVRVLPQELLLLSHDGQLFLDGCVSFEKQYVLREGGAIQHCADDGRLLLRLPERRIAIDAPCIWLGSGSDNFQWLCESLARLWTITQQPDLQDLPLLVQDGLSRWQDEMLQLLGYAAQKRITVPADAVLECRELHVASLVTAGYFIAPVAVQHLRRELMRHATPAADAPRRIFLSRQGAATRRLGNEAALLPLLRQRGYTVVHSDGMSASEQLALFQSAEVILALEEDALVNLLIAPAHARVGVIVARGRYLPRHHYLSAPIGQDFTYLSAEVDFASHAVLAECDLLLPPEVLEAFLAGCR